MTLTLSHSVPLSSVLVYHSNLQGKLKGRIVQVLEIGPNKPIAFGILENDEIKVMLKKPKALFSAFVSEILHFLSNSPMMYLFNSDILKLQSYSAENIDQKWIKGEFDIEINKENYPDDLSIWGHVSHEHFTRGFYTARWYNYYSTTPEYGQKIIDFTVGMLLNKLALIVDQLAIIRTHRSDVVECLQAKLPISMEKNTIIDIQTTGLEEDAVVISCGITNRDTIHIGWKTKDTKSITEYMHNKYQRNDQYFTYSADFKQKFITNLNIQLQEIRPSSYYKYTPRRKTIYLPRDHDPGKSSNIPIWFQQYESTVNRAKKIFWRNLILLHSYASIVNQSLLVMMRESPVQFQDSHYLINFEMLSPESTANLISEIHRKPEFKPAIDFEYYLYLDGKYANMYKIENQIEMGLLVPDKLIDEMLTEAGYTRMFYRQLPAQEPYYGDEISNNRILIPEIKNQLIANGINRLYTYQETAFKFITAGRDVVLTAPTGNGKTEAFLLPTYQLVLQLKKIDNSQFLKTIIFYPTKALANDQYDKIRQDCDVLGIVVKQLDGDVDRKDRIAIYAHPPDILITTPDLIHYNLRKFNFRAFVSTTRMMIFDEIHTYDGIFGTHIHYLLWRLNRIVENDPQYVAASATIGNPADFCRQLFNRTMRLVECKRGKRPQLDIIGINHKNFNQGLTSLVKSLAKQDHTTLIFRKSQQGSERTYNKLIQSNLKINIGIHRGGYDKEYRREIEQGLKDEKFDAVVCTATLELGLDIGGVSSVITPIVPVNRLLQRTGRAGRRNASALIFIECPDDPVGFYYASNPDKYLQELSDVNININNPIVLQEHLVLAAQEKPLVKKDVINYKDIITNLLENNRLTVENRAFVSTQKEPIFGLRQSVAGIKLMLPNGYIIGNRGLPHGITELYPGAKLLWKGKTLQVDEIKPTKRDWIAKVHYVKDSPKRSITMPIINRTINMEEYETEWHGELMTYRGTTSINLTVEGYVELSGGKKEHIVIDPVNYSFQTQALIIDLHPYLHSQLSQIKGVVNTSVIRILLHTLSHVILQSARMLLSSGNILQLVETRLDPHNNYQLAFYDNTVGGVGIIDQMSKNLDSILQRGLEMMTNCNCQSEAGCPRCLVLYRCVKGNKMLKKQLTIAHLTRINKSLEENT